MSYYRKYIKYKKKYYDLKESTNNNVYILHTPLQFDNIIGILNDGVIKLGSDLPENLRNLSKFEPLPYIFGRFFFSDIPETHIKWNILVFDKKILDDYDIAFNDAWFAGINNNSIMFYHNDTLDTRQKKLNLVKKLIKEKTCESDIMNHELLFQKRIKIKKYLRAIVFYWKDEKQHKILEDIIKKKYENVMILDDIKKLV